MRKVVAVLRTLAWQLASLMLEHGNFLNIGISQGSVATRLKCEELFNNDLVANLLVSLCH